MSGVLTAIGIAATLYLAFVGMLWLTQPRLVFQPGTPTREIQRTPAAAGLEYETVRFETRDRVALSGWYVPGPTPDAPVVLFFHGNAGNIGDRIETLSLLHTAGAATFIFDYRGFGESEGRPSERGTYADARAAWSWLLHERNVPVQRVVLFGRSLGAAIATELAAEVRPAGLVLEAAFTSLPDLAAHHYPWVPVRWIARYEYNTGHALTQVGCPALVAHARDDEIVPFEHGRRLGAIRPPVVDFIELAGGHNDAWLRSQPEYRQALARFLERVTARPQGRRDG